MGSIGQRVLYDGYLVHDVFSHILDLYYDISLPNVHQIEGVSLLSPLASVLRKGYGNFAFKEKQVKFSSLSVQKTNNIVVCFSGGKDSVAVALHFRSLGKNVFLYHLRGINKSYPDEHIRAERVAALMGLPLYVDKVQLVGKNIYKENPIKNQVVATLALNYAVQQGLGAEIAFGDFTDDSVSTGVFDRNWSDTKEMWDAFRLILEGVIPNFKIEIPFKNYLETLLLVAQNKNLLVSVQGCMAPQRFRRHWHDSNSQKYKIELLPNRCGSCWKCCVEYIYLTDNGLLNYNQEFYFHCLRVLKEKIPTEHPECGGVSSYADVYKVYIPAPVPKRVYDFPF